jgi:hypothetical protein
VSFQANIGVGERLTNETEKRMDKQEVQAAVDPELIHLAGHGDQGII